MFSETKTCFHPTSPPPNFALNHVNKNLESTSNETCHCREQTCNVQTAYQKIDKIQKTKINLRYEKRYNLRSSTYQNITLPNFRYHYIVCIEDQLPPPPTPSKTSPSLSGQAPLCLNLQTLNRLHWGLKPPQKHPSHLSIFLAKPPLKQQAVQAPLHFRQSPPFY